MPRGPKPLRSPLKSNQFYCVSCRSRMTVDEEDMCIKAGTKKTRGVPMVKSVCSQCNHKMNKFISKDNAKALRADLGACRR
jgi:hypothetical protein